jgi:hypothetical protein
MVNCSTIEMCLILNTDWNMYKASQKARNPYIIIIYLGYLKESIVSLQ